MTFRFMDRYMPVWKALRWRSHDQFKYEAPLLFTVLYLEAGAGKRSIRLSWEMLHSHIRTQLWWRGQRAQDKALILLTYLVRVYLHNMKCKALRALSFAGFIPYNLVPVYRGTLLKDRLRAVAARAGYEIPGKRV